MIDSVKEAKPGQWYFMLKRITRFDQGKSEQLQVEEISHLIDQQQAEMIADKQAEISNLYKEVQLSDIHIPPFSKEDIPQISLSKVKEYISRLNQRNPRLLGISLLKNQRIC